MLGKNSGPALLVRSRECRDRAIYLERPPRPRPPASARLVQQVSDKALRHEGIINIRHLSPGIVDPLVCRSLSQPISDIPKGTTPSVFQLGGNRGIRRLQRCNLLPVFQIAQGWCPGLQDLSGQLANQRPVAGASSEIVCQSKFNWLLAKFPLRRAGQRVERQR